MEFYLEKATEASVAWLNLYLITTIYPRSIDEWYEFRSRINYFLFNETFASVAVVHSTPKSISFRKIINFIPIIAMIQLFTEF